MPALVTFSLFNPKDKKLIECAAPWTVQMKALKWLQNDRREGQHPKAEGKHSQVLLTPIRDASVHWNLQRWFWRQRGQGGRCGGWFPLSHDRAAVFGLLLIVPERGWLVRWCCLLQLAGSKWLLRESSHPQVVGVADVCGSAAAEEKKHC